MLISHTKTEREFVRGSGYGDFSLRPVSVQQRITYRNNKLASHMFYDTDVHSESDVESMLKSRPAYVSRLFRGMISYLSRRIWRLKNV